MSFKKLLQIQFALQQSYFSSIHMFFFIEPTPKTWIFLVNFLLRGVQKQKGGGGQGLSLGWMQYGLYSGFFGFPEFLLIH